MAKTAIIFNNEGGGGIEIQQATHVTSTNITGNWDFDADCLFLSHNVGTTKQLLLIDLNSTALYYTNDLNSKWTLSNWSTVGWTANLTSRSFNITANTTITNACFVPFKGKPTGYFS